MKQQPGRLWSCIQCCLRLPEQHVAATAAHVLRMLWPIVWHTACVCRMVLWRPRPCVWRARRLASRVVASRVVAIATAKMLLRGSQPCRSAAWLLLMSRSGELRALEETLGPAGGGVAGGWKLLRKGCPSEASRHSTRYTACICTLCGAFCTIPGQLPCSNTERQAGQCRG